MVQAPGGSRPAGGPLFAALAATSSEVARLPGRLDKKRALVEHLRGIPPEDLAAAVGWLVGEPLGGPLGVGPAHLGALSRTSMPEDATVTLREVAETLEAVREGARRDVLPRVSALFARFTRAERDLFVGALTQSLRQGSLGGVMLLALVELSGLEEAAVRRAVMVTGSIARATDALVGRGRGAPPPSSLELFRPIAPMLASPAASLDQAFADAPGELLVEQKADGVRAQVHKSGERVAVYSRQGNDVTAGCGPLLPALAALPVGSVVLDGEVLLVGPDGRPRPFQDTFSAVASGGQAPAGDRLAISLFDCMHVDGRDLLDEPLSVRREALASFAPAELVMPSLRAEGVEAARAFERAALAEGHEGVMVKDLASPYRAGARGHAWQKVKEHATVDLVVLAVEHGSGRRTGTLSNLHLGARREDGTFCMVGKTFKGLTDELLAWQTERLRALSIEEKGHVVYVLPELVVEIRYSDVQRSPRYPGGIALRFARVVRYREDKPASEAESLDDLVGRLPEGAAPRTAAPRPKAPAKKKGRADDRQLSLFGPKSS